MPTSLVIGAGWAGLNCAYELAKAGHQVTVLEAAPNIGGRARCVPFGATPVDNGQHIALGAYHTLRQIFKELSLDEAEFFKILPLDILTFGNDAVRLRLPQLRAPFNLLLGVLNCNFTWAEKFHIIKFAYSIQKLQYQLPADCTIYELLVNYNQSTKVITHLWQPIALAAMSTEIKQASAQVFVNILREIFTGTNTMSHWYLPSKDLSTLLPQQLVTFLEQKQHQVLCNSAVKNLKIHNGRCTQVETNTNVWHADNIVLCIAPWQAYKLLQPHAPLHELCNALQKFRYEAITTVYLQFDHNVKLSYPIIGMVGATCQWIFDREFANQPDILSIVITGTIAAQYSDNALLYAHVLQEIRTQFPHLTNPIAYKIIREKRAAFSCDVAIQSQRPTPRTAVTNLWLSGDYLQTGLPATLEGALLSGKQTSIEMLTT